MNEKKRAKMFKWFWAWQDEKKEAWLTNMSRNGWHLEDVDFLGMRYHFAQGDGEEFVYRLDYRANKDVNLSEYVDFIEDTGWKYVLGSGGWQYFRKPKGSSGHAEIFTDNDSKVKKYQRVLLLLVFFYPAALVVFLGRLDIYPTWFATILVGTYVFLMITVGVSIIGIFLRIKELRRM